MLILVNPCAPITQAHTHSETHVHTQTHMNTHPTVYINILYARKHTHVNTCTYINTCARTHRHMHINARPLQASVCDFLFLSSRCSFPHCSLQTLTVLRIRPLQTPERKSIDACDNSRRLGGCSRGQLHWESWLLPDRGN